MFGGSGFVPDDDDGREEVIHTTQPNLSSRGSGRRSRTITP
jgi:hypothetical protein